MVTSRPRQLPGQHRAAVDEHARAVQRAPSPSSRRAASCRSRRSRPARRSSGARTTASIESAISSRDTRLMRMPLWFIDTPSDTEMVVNGTAMPCPRRHAEPRRIGLRPERHRARRVLAVLADDAHHRLAEVLVGDAHRAQERAMRHPIETLDDEAGAQRFPGRMVAHWASFALRAAEFALGAARRLMRRSGRLPPSTSLPSPHRRSLAGAHRAVRAPAPPARRDCRSAACEMRWSRGSAPSGGSG